MYRSDNIIIYLIVFIALLAFVHGTIGPLTDSSLGDEWIGPLPEWQWVTRDFGAKGIFMLFVLYFTISLNFILAFHLSFRLHS
jgi:hypothetical protein